MKEISRNDAIAIVQSYNSDEQKVIRRQQEVSEQFDKMMFEIEKESLRGQSWAAFSYPLEENVLKLKQLGYNLSVNVPEIEPNIWVSWKQHKNYDPSAEPTNNDNLMKRIKEEHKRQWHENPKYSFLFKQFLTF